MTLGRTGRIGLPGGVEFPGPVCRGGKEHKACVPRADDGRE